MEKLKQLTNHRQNCRCRDLWFGWHDFLAPPPRRHHTIHLGLMPDADHRRKQLYLLQMRIDCHICHFSILTKTHLEVRLPDAVQEQRCPDKRHATPVAAGAPHLLATDVPTQERPTFRTSVGPSNCNPNEQQNQQPQERHLSPTAQSHSAVKQFAKQCLRPPAPGDPSTFVDFLEQEVVNDAAASVTKIIKLQIRIRKALSGSESQSDGLKRRRRKENFIKRMEKLLTGNQTTSLRSGHKTVCPCNSQNIPSKCCAAKSFGMKRVIHSKCQVEPL
ncbi:unnamed protein product [Notodromas monacha]|uniref:Uncharacterized protein n=1 Tax=Notodromas monacha TaxID=399045 RepID=A0A7R9BU16_9CRUS|nr:unnamed protein product [Notodromas monacha]CAG0921744.1 unnamed protein product [Notodromas monacha]